MRRLAVVVLLILLSGCTLFGKSGWREDTAKEQLTIEKRDETRRAAVSLIHETATEALGELEKDPVTRVEVEAAKENLEKTTTLSGALTRAEGPPVHPVAPTVEVVKEIAKVIPEHYAEAEAAEKSIEAKIDKLEDRLTGGKPSSFWSKVKLAILGVLAIGSVAIYLYLRITSTKLLSTLVGAGCLAVLGVYTWLLFWKLILVVGLAAIGLIGLFFILKALGTGKKAKELIHNTQIVRTSLDKVDRDKVDKMLAVSESSELSEFIKGIKKASSMPSASINED